MTSSTKNGYLWNCFFGANLHHKQGMNEGGCVVFNAADVSRKV